MTPNVELFIENQQSEATKKAYRYDLNKWFDFLGKEKPTKDISLRFRRYLESNLHPRSAARVFNTCRSYYRWVGGPNPFASLKSTKRVSNSTPKVPEDSLVDHMVTICDNPRDSLVLALLLNGLRASEVADMTPDSVAWSEEYGMFLLRVVGKGYKERLVPATDETDAALRRWTPGTKFLVFNSRGRRMSMRQVEYVVEKWSTAAGRTIRPHKLRHHYATRLVRSDAGLLAVSQLLGHASVATTQIYASLDLSSVIRASQKDPRNVVKEKGLRIVA